MGGVRTGQLSRLINIPIQTIDMNPTQKKLENTYHRAGASASLLYEMIPVTYLLIGETTQELTRKRRPFDDITEGQFDIVYLMVVVL